MSPFCCGCQLSALPLGCKIVRILTELCFVPSFTIAPSASLTASHGWWNSDLALQPSESRILLDEAVIAAKTVSAQLPIKLTPQQQQQSQQAPQAQQSHQSQQAQPESKIVQATVVESKAAPPESVSASAQSVVDDVVSVPLLLDLERVWSGGIGCSERHSHVSEQSRALVVPRDTAPSLVDENRTAVLRCLLLCLSEPIFVSQGAPSAQQDAFLFTAAKSLRRRVRCWFIHVQSRLRLGGQRACADTGLLARQLDPLLPGCVAAQSSQCANNLA